MNLDDIRRALIVARYGSARPLPPPLRDDARQPEEPTMQPNPLQEALGFRHRSLNDAYDLNRAGRLSDNGLRWFVFLWRWGAPRLSDLAHTAAYARLGSAGYWRRINRVRARYLNLPPYGAQP